MLGAIKKKEGRNSAWLAPHCVYTREHVSVRVKREALGREREREVEGEKRGIRYRGNVGGIYLTEKLNKIISTWPGIRFYDRELIS